MLTRECWKQKKKVWTNLRTPHLPSLILQTEVETGGKISRISGGGETPQDSQKQRRVGRDKEERMGVD